MIAGEMNNDDSEVDSEVIGSHSHRRRRSCYSESLDWKRCISN